MSPRRTLLVCDLDGTLTFARRRPEPVVMERLAALLNADRPVRLVIATARSPRCVRAWFSEFADQIEMICCNGALLLSRSLGVRRSPLPEVGLATVVRRLDAAGVGYCLEYGDHFAASGPEALPWMGDLHRVVPVRGAAEGDLSTVIKCSVADADAAADAVAGIAGLRAIRHATGDADVMAAGVSKGVAVARLRAPDERVIAFGNDLNDLSMLRAADLGFVVGDGLAQADRLDHVCRLAGTPYDVAAALTAVGRVDGLPVPVRRRSTLAGAVG